MPTPSIPQIHIDTELQTLIPPLSPDEYNALENSLLTDGCRDSLTLWGNTLIDGHNRLEICKKHNIPYTTKQMHFEGKTDAVLWMIQNQLARRNLTPFARAELVAKSSGIIERLKDEARERQLSGLNNSLVRQNFAEREYERPRDTLAKMAEVSHETFRKVQIVTNQAPESIKALARQGELSTDNAYKITKALQGASDEVKQAVVTHTITAHETIKMLANLHPTSETLQDVLTNGYIDADGEQIHITESPLKIRDAIQKRAQAHKQIAMDSKSYRANPNRRDLILYNTGDVSATAKALIAHYGDAIELLITELQKSACVNAKTALE